MLSKYPTIKEALERAERCAQDLPHIVQVNERDWDTVVLANEVKRLQREVERLTPKKIQPPTSPITPWPGRDRFACPKCGLVIEGAMGYVCNVPMCPTGLGGSWCSTDSKHVD